MRKWTMIAGATAAALYLGAVPAAAGATTAAKSDAPDKLVCKVRQRTGTRFGTKICRTNSEWDQIAEDSRRNLKETVDRPEIKACGPSGCD